ncbi:MAG: hypothetical protein WBV79_15700 [Rhodomicrobium sp.]
MFYDSWTDVIAADAETLMRQAYKTAAEYLNAAVREIDAEFGEGYAAKHPELVAAFMQTAAHDYRSASVSKYIGGTLSRIADSLTRVADAIRKEDAEGTY